jgi:RHS repeat-associated protein
MDKCFLVQDSGTNYDPNLNPEMIIDPNSQEWQYTYNTKGNIETTTSPLNEITRYEYNDPIHTGILLTKVIDPKGNITRYEYDINSNLWKTINVDMINGTPYDRVTRIERYNISDHPEWNGLTKSVTDPRNNTTTYEYDSSGYLYKITDPLGKITQFTHDAGGRLTNKIDADGVSVSYTYDSMNRVKTVTDHQGRVTTYNYDANGNRTSIVDPRNIKGEFIYREDSDLLDTVNNINLFTQANTMIVKQDYDPLGRLTKVTNAKNQTWQNTYDDVGNIKSEKTPIGYEDLYQLYDYNRNLTRFKDRTGRIIDYTYDYTNRLKTQVVPGGQYSFNYLENGLLQSASFPNQSSISRFEYTTRSQVKKYTDPYGMVVDYTYDEVGNLKTITFNGKTVTYNYDQRNLLESVTDWLNRTTWYEYTDAGRLKKITYPNSAYIEYVYDSANPARVQFLNNKKSDGNLIVGYAVGTFDALDAPEQIATSGGIEPVGQPYDSGSVDYDANNRMLNSGFLITFTHNNQGELETKTKNSVTTYFDWDANDVPGRLKRIRKDTSTIEFVYDAFGNRIASTKNGVTTRYVLDVSGEMSNVIAETDTSGNIKAYYVHGLGLISKILPDGTARYYHYDMIGNTVALTDDSGNITDQYAYSTDPYGFSVTSQGTTENPFKFVGQYGVMDEGNNIYFMRARYYDAETGRFLNEDPLGFEGGDRNLYAYVGGNPVVNIDPEGMMTYGGFLYSVTGIVDPFYNIGKSLYNKGKKISENISNSVKNPNIQRVNIQAAIDIGKEVSKGMATGGINSQTTPSPASGMGTIVRGIEALAEQGVNIVTKIPPQIKQQMEQQGCDVFMDRYGVNNSYKDTAKEVVNSFYLNGNDRIMQDRQRNVENFLRAKCPNIFPD